MAHLAIDCHAYSIEESLTHFTSYYTKMACRALDALI